MCWLDKVTNKDYNDIDYEIKEMDMSELIDNFKLRLEEYNQELIIEDEYGDDENDYDADYYENEAYLAESEEYLSDLFFTMLKKDEERTAMEFPEEYTKYEMFLSEI